ncbi:hypothetical protein BDZ89DRAFT_969589, partial [Hymenopellis radicata]
KKKWTSSVYIFFQEPTVEIVNGRKAHVFRCGARGCKHQVNRYQDDRVNTKDRNSPSNLRSHAVTCWGKDTVVAADKTTAEGAREALKKHEKHPDGDIKSFFQRQTQRTGRPTYSDRRHTPAQARLQKTGRPDYYIPHPTTVSRDVKQIYAITRGGAINKTLQEYEGDLSFSYDTWTSPNHIPYGALCVDRLAEDGTIESFLLDFIDLPKRHTGLNMALQIARIINEFGLGHKVSWLIHLTSI